jgi:hypothetical protein
MNVVAVGFEVFDFDVRKTRRVLRAHQNGTPF